MTLTPHAIVGGAIMNFMPQYPVLGLFLAFASHFVLDAIPHLEYRLDSYDYNKKEPLKSVIHLNKKFLADLAKMGLDGTFGLIITIVIFSSPPAGGPLLIALGAIGAMLPDFFQFLYLQMRREPFTSLQRLHLWAHSKYTIRKIGFTGIILQNIIILSVGAIFW